MFFRKISDKLCENLEEIPSKFPKKFKQLSDKFLKNYGKTSSESSEILYNAVKKRLFIVFFLSRESTRGRGNPRPNEAASFAFGLASGCLRNQNIFQRTFKHRAKTTRASALPHFDLPTVAGSD